MVLAYALPFIIIGLGGMVNETLDRILLQKLLPGGEEVAKQTVAVYSANYKLAIFITLFIQAFRMAAEPFFFREAAGKNAPQTYARVMKWFVLTLCIAFLGTVLFLDAWKYMVGPSYRSGLGVVPILLAANVALGIYYNLSVWYKITGKLRWGTIITLWGAALTLVLNALFIPRYGMWASAWATFICYTTMMLLSYFLGQKYYPVPYNLRKLGTYLGAAALLFAIHAAVAPFLSTVGHLLAGAGLMLSFFLLMVRMERTELQRFPVIGRFLR
jgi:O-antigen/teichoic acid export membrane protein